MSIDKLTKHVDLSRLIPAEDRATFKGYINSKIVLDETTQLFLQTACTPARVLELAQLLEGCVLPLDQRKRLNWYARSAFRIEQAYAVSTICASDSLAYREGAVEILVRAAQTNRLLAQRFLPGHESTQMYLLDQATTEVDSAAKLSCDLPTCDKLSVYREGLATALTQARQRYTRTPDSLRHTKVALGYAREILLHATPDHFMTDKERNTLLNLLEEVIDQKGLNSSQAGTFLDPIVAKLAREIKWIVPVVQPVIRICAGYCRSRFGPERLYNLPVAQTS